MYGVTGVVTGGSRGSSSLRNRHNTEGLDLSRLGQPRQLPALRKPITAAEYYNAERARPLTQQSQLGPPIFAQARRSQHRAPGARSSVTPSFVHERPDVESLTGCAPAALGPGPVKYLVQGIRAATLQNQKCFTNMPAANEANMLQTALRQSLGGRSTPSSFQGTIQDPQRPTRSSWLWPGVGGGAGVDARSASPTRSVTPAGGFKSVFQSSYGDVTRHVPIPTRRSRSTEPPRNGSHNWLFARNQKPQNPILRTMTPLDPMAP